jgi:hypothetical protein
MEHETFWGVGVQGGLATGMGLGVRFAINRFAFEVNGGYLAIEQPLWSIGGEVQFTFATAETYRVYALGGISSNYVGDADTNSLEAPGRFGLGVAFEWFFAPTVSLAAELPFTVFIEPEPTVLPLPQVQFMFYFQ